MIFALAGNQNCGKTTLFNALTDSNQHVGNFPGVTVDQKTGEIRGEKGCSVVSTLEVLLGGSAVSGLFTTRSALSFLVFTLLYTPCVAAVATIRRELDSSLKALGVVAMQCGVAWLASLAMYAVAGLF